ncbi:MAG: glutaminyl-peptide cyclotransferase [Gammaproteobacteria bacterium]
MALKRFPAVRWLLWLPLAFALTGCRGNTHTGDYRFEILNRLPHDPNAYTQGLLFHDGYFYESTGLNGQSSLRQVDPMSGKILRKRDLPSAYFGEGLALLHGVLLQITWRNHKAFAYRLETLEQIGEFDYDTEGWGLTTDGQQWIMSDGSDRLYFRDPKTFQTLRTLTVFDQGKSVTNLNELEYIDGEIWANVYLTDRIVRIDPTTGQVTGRLNLGGIVAATERNGHEDVLNGIAYDADGKRLFVTGKLYSYVYEIAAIATGN